MRKIKYLSDLHTAYKIMRLADKPPKIVNAANKEFHYFVFQNHSTNVGLMTHAAQVACYSDYCERNGLKLVVDMQTYPCVNSEPDRVGIDNVWEYYYEQPFPNAPLLDELLQYHSYLMAPDYRKELLYFYRGINRSLGYRWFYNKKADFHAISIDRCVADPAEYDHWRHICRKYLRLNEKTKAYVDQEYASIMEGKRVLGISMRGTDYTVQRAYGHAVQPTFEEMLEKAKEYVSQYGYEYLYVSCEERAMVEKFEIVFPGKVLVNNRKFFDHVDFTNKRQGIGDVHFEREHDAYLRGLEYLSSMYLLSRCNALIAGKNTGSQMAYMFSDGNYEHVYFFNKGRYGIDEVKEG